MITIMIIMIIILIIITLKQHNNHKECNIYIYTHKWEEVPSIGLSKDTLFQGTGTADRKYQAMPSGSKLKSAFGRVPTQNEEPRPDAQV